MAITSSQGTDSITHVPGAPRIHFGGTPPNNTDTSDHDLSVNFFLWVSLTNLEANGDVARYFAGFAHL
jgi:hypothetical protein